METIANDEYECFTCSVRFKKKVFSITREWERVDFSEALPEVDILDAYGLECYCSKSCLEGRRDEVMARGQVSITRPNLGPVETCAKCGGPVDMSEFHLAYLEDESIDEGTFVSTMIDLDYLAVVCKRCHPKSAAQFISEDVAIPDSLQVKGCSESLT